MEHDCRVHFSSTMTMYKRKLSEDTAHAKAWYDLKDWESEGEEITNLEERWRHLWENVPDVILEVDIGGKISIINKVLPEFTIEQVIGTSIFDYIPEHQHGAMRSAMTTILETGDMHQYEIPAFTNNRTTWWSNRIFPISHNDQIVGFLIIASNITDLKEREQELQIQNKKLKALTKEQAKFEKKLKALEEENQRLKKKEREA